MPFSPGAAMPICAIINNPQTQTSSPHSMKPLIGVYVGHFCLAKVANLLLFARLHIDHLTGPSVAAGSVDIGQILAYMGAALAGGFFSMGCSSKQVGLI